MSAKEPVTIKLGTIKDLIAAGDEATALEHLNALLAEEPIIEAHVLRLKIVSQNVLEHISLIVESLEGLHKEDVPFTKIKEYFAPIETAIMPRLVEIHQAVLQGQIETYYDEINLYEPLTKYLPYIHVVLGYVCLNGKHEKDLDPLSILESLLADFSSLDEAASPKKIKRDTEKAQKHFEQAIHLLPSNDPHYLDAVYGMALTYELADKLPEALEWYSRAQSKGLAVAHKVKSIRQSLINAFMDILMVEVDIYHAYEHIDKAKAVLDQYTNLHGYAFYDLRWADYYYLLGDYASAHTLYTQCNEVDLQITVDVAKFSHLSAESLIVQIKSINQVLDSMPDDERDIKSHRWLILRYEIGRTLIRLRPLCGLVAVTWQQGDYATAQSLLQELMKRNELSKEAQELLIADLEKVEKLKQESALASFRKARDSAWQGANWPALQEAAQAVARLVGSDEVDTVWLAAALFKAGAAAESQVHLLKHLAPERIRDLPPVLGRELLRGLGAAGHWYVTDRFVDVVANAGGWRAAYSRERAAFLEGWYSSTQQAFDQGLYEHAFTQVQRLLTVAPEHPQGRLLLAQLRMRDGFYAEARKIATHLLQVGEITEAATVLLVKLDMAEGYLTNAEQRLAHLPVTVAESLRLALTNRLEQRPYIHLETVDEVVSADILIRRKTAPVTTAVFAVELKSVRSVREAQPVVYHCFTLLTALERVVDQLGLPVSFAWRYIAESGQLRILLLCRVEALHREQVNYAAENLWQTIRGLLPLQDEQIYTYEPVTEPNLLDYVRMPDGLGSAVEITRQEVGVRNGEKGDIPLIHPFTYSTDDLHRTLRLLLEQPHKTVLDIHFHPTALFAWERSAIQNMLGDHFYANSNENGIRYMLGEERYYQAMKIYPDFLMKADWMAFVTRIHLVSVGELNPALPNVVATSLFGPSRYALVPAMTDADLATVQRNLYTVAAERWGYAVPVPRLERLPYLLTVGEALSATRLPLPGPDGLPGLASLKIKATPLPANLPTEGTLIGEGIASVRGRPVQVKISPFDRMRHAYVVGRTGTGKSTLLQNMAMQDIEDGHGVAVIDPHGDLVEAILERIPPHRVQDVVLFDPSDTDRPIGLNTLDVNGTFEKNMVVAEFIGLMYSMFDPNKVGIVGPRFENAVRNAMLTAMAIPGNTLIEVVRILSERSYLKQSLAIINDPVVKGYWEDIVGNMSDFHKSEVLDYITSKFGRFITDHLIRNIIGQSKNSLDFADIMDKGKILLVNLAKGKIGPQNSHFLGLLLVPRLLIAALSRARMGVQQRRLFCLYVDEFHNFTTPAFSVMLSEARKYGMALTMANQFISQLDNDIRESVFGNVGTLLAFQVGIKDAQFIAPEMYPVFNVDDMVNLPNYHLLGKMLVKGAVAPQFALRTLPDTRLASTETANAIRELSRQRYGRNVALVTHEINQRFSLSPKERLAQMQEDNE